MEGRAGQFVLVLHCIEEFMKTALAWKNLTSSKSKFALAAMGVGFAVLLMFMQLGFRNALIENNVQLFSLFDMEKANLAVISRARYNVSTEQRFPRVLLNRIVADKRIRDYCTVSLERGTASVKVKGSTAKPIRVIGISLGKEPFIAKKKLYADLAVADARQSALVDARSKSYYHFQYGEPQVVELNGIALKLSDQKFELGTDFGNDGTLLMSERMHANYFAWRSRTGDPRDVVDIAFLNANVPESELQELASEIQGIAPAEIVVKPTKTLREEEVKFWSTATPVGIIFNIGTVMGLVVGAIICYQIQYTDITDHMPEFATLKAMGYSPGYFWSVILCQSFYLANIGFVPGAAVSWALYQLLSSYSGLIMTMGPDTIFTVWVLTLLMCVVSGVLAIRKLFGADPASLF